MAIMKTTHGQPQLRGEEHHKHLPHHTARTRSIPHTFFLTELGTCKHSYLFLHDFFILELNRVAGPDVYALQLELKPFKARYGYPISQYGEEPVRGCAWPSFAPTSSVG